MIKISLRYPYTENGRFDIDYYVNKHAPFARNLMGAAQKGFEIDRVSAVWNPAQIHPVLQLQLCILTL